MLFANGLCFGVLVAPVTLGVVWVSVCSEPWAGCVLFDSLGLRLALRFGACGGLI